MHKTGENRNKAMANNRLKLPPKKKRTTTTGVKMTIGDLTEILFVTLHVNLSRHFKENER